MCDELTCHEKKRPTEFGGKNDDRGVSCDYRKVRCERRFWRAETQYIGRNPNLIGRYPLARSLADMLRLTPSPSRPPQIVSGHPFMMSALRGEGVRELADFADEQY